MSVRQTSSADITSESINNSESQYSARKPQTSTSNLFACGLVSGILQAAVFNPWDRGLYLSVKHHRVFLDRLNFEKPMEGLWQTITQRAISAGLYFPLENVFMVYLCDNCDADKYLSRQTISFLAGTMAGVSNGLFLNPFAAVKYHTWGSDKYPNFFTTAKDMYKRGGIKSFFLGTSATVSRDFIFGGVFALLRHEFRYKAREEKIKINHFFLDVAAGCCATLASSPVNYVRNIKYAFPAGHEHDKATKILRDLWTVAMSHPTWFGKIHYLQERLKIGWGTARVGCGMAFASLIYTFGVDLISAKQHD
eukprot:CAMPEP_0182425332 /NCGR_PEP_ID=MMETSP1167-20130531/11732_1 /TAXON_ID=2988 /ORGANISM="Mallomonas Sp, Strain CCMP3275" /LENGTH=307 /DNA_ID=CAMNT_0024605937 /DNA_START=77 /DNA_END=1000 /DNA_ORIENTATION=+